MHHIDEEHLREDKFELMIIPFLSSSGSFTKLVIVDPNNIGKFPLHTNTYLHHTLGVEI